MKIESMTIKKPRNVNTSRTENLEVTLTLEKR